MRREIQGEWLMALSGVASIIFGILLTGWPDAGLLTLVWLIEAYALLFGILLIALAFRLRNLSHDQTYHHPTPGAPGMA